MATQQGGAEIYENISPTITAAAGTSGNNQPVICFHLLQDPVPIEDITPCLSTGNSDHGQASLGVCYSLDRASFNQGKNAQFDIGIDDSGTAHTLVAKGPNAVAYGVPLNFRPENTRLYEEKATTICNGTNPGHHQGVLIINPLMLIVRRLTPTECARLQGMPDWWCDELGTPEPTEEEIDLWTERFETWRQIADPDKKPKTRKQIEKWLKDPNSDSAEYKMWGNGMALPCVMFVMQEVVKVLRRRRLEAILE